MEYYLFTTNECNLNCSYCSVVVDARKHGIPLQPQYSIDELNQFIESIQKKYHDDNIDIVFFGGEPTLNFNFIEDVIVQQRKAFGAYKVRYMLHTNGLLLEKLPDVVLNRINTIMLSINGLAMPVGYLNNDYLEQIVRSISYVKLRSSIPIIGRLTITSESSLFTLVMSMHPFFDYVYWQIENCYNFKNPVAFIESYSKDMRLLLEVWSYYIDHGIVLKFIPFLTCAFSICAGIEPQKFLCGYDDSMVYIQTDGVCYSCAEDFLSKHNVIGHIKGSVDFSGYSLNDTKCLRCEYVHFCHGRCGRMHREFTDKHIQEYCDMNKVMFSFFDKNRSKILDTCRNHNITLEDISSITNYTEFIP